MTTTTGRVLVVVATVLSLGHHVDHVVRGNHTGWPLVQAVTPFTVSLMVYPVIALGLLLSATGRPDHAYWTVVAGAGAVFLSATHLGPSALEPPADIIGEYPPPAGWVAFGWLLALIAVLGALAWYEGRLWWQARRTTPPAGGGGSRAT